MRKNLVRWSALAAAVATVVAVGCGDSSAPAVQYPSLDQFAQDVATAACSPAVVSGCAIGTGTTGQATCVQAIVNACTSHSFEACRRYDAASYQGSREAGCVSAVQAAYTDAIVDANDVAAIDAACFPAFSALSPQGLACQSNYDCNTGLKCFFNKGTGTCLPPTQVPGNAVCDPTKGDECADTTLSCLPGFTPGSDVCQPRIAAGQNCILLGDRDVCETSARCVPVGTPAPSGGGSGGAAGSDSGGSGGSNSGGSDGTSAGGTTTGSAGSQGVQNSNYICQALSGQTQACTTNDDCQQNLLCVTQRDPVTNGIRHVCLPQDKLTDFQYLSCATFGAQ